MFALIENQQITKHLSGNKGITLGDIQYPRSIFTLWSEAERNAIGIFEVTVDTTNKKDEQWYINTNVSYGVESNKAVGSYGTATAKAHADANGTDADGVELDPVVVIPGLKTNLIKDLKINVANELARTDWYITRNTEKSTAIPSAISTHRDAVRTKQAEMETAITNAVDTPALETLYTYTTTDGVQSRPLGELPTLES